MNVENIKTYFSTLDLDLRKSRDARWIDQKCTPDVVSFIADCVINYLEENPTKTSFVVNDIWNSTYFNENVTAVFGKPDAQNEGASSEYDKFIQQPLRMLGYAQVLNCVKLGTTNNYSIKNNELLEFISQKDRNSYRFLYEYIVKVLKDSDILKDFEHFKMLFLAGKATKTEFAELKTKYEDFILANTPINQRVEIRRIFTKILNPYAVENKIAGTIKGRMSDKIMNFSDLMYNRENWRDVYSDKSKGITRQEFESTLDNNVAEIYNKYLVQKMMNQIKRKYQISEVKDEWANGDATQVHHIFMKSDFPQIAHYLENLIKLTPTQHYTKAHPNNNTQIIDKNYQYICLVSKSNSIEISLSNNEDFYSTENFVFVLNAGLYANLSNNSTLQEIRSFLAREYNRN
jgi:hypothetical protein